MTRRLWISAVLLAGTAATTALLPSQGRSTPADLPKSATNLVPAPEVRVRHHFVTVAPPPVVPGVAPHLSRPASSLSVSHSVPAASGVRSRRSREDMRVLFKVGRAVTGDGRHRPEPFPRLK